MSTTDQKVAARFAELCTFTAIKCAQSEALGHPDARIICKPGDTVHVERWHCQDGPTVVKVGRMHDGKLLGREHCIPFAWVMEMGAPTELRMYMPPTRRSRDEVLAESTKSEA